MRPVVPTIAAALASIIASCQQTGPDWSQLEIEPSSPNVVLWNGTSWSSLGEGFDSLVVRVESAPDGTLYAGGYFSKSGDSACNHIARWDAGASSWKPVGRGVNGTVRAFAFHGSDVIVGGLFSEVYNPDGTVVRADCLALWDGQSWRAFGGVRTDFVRELIVTHGTVFAGGTSKLYRLDPTSLSVE